MVDQVRERLAGLELAQAGEVDDLLGAPARGGEQVDAPLVRPEGGELGLLSPGAAGALERQGALAVEGGVAAEEIRLRTMGHSSMRRKPSISTDSARSGEAVSLSHSTPPGLELVGAALPAEEPVDGLGGLERGHLPEVLAGDDPQLHQDVAQAAQRAPLHVEGVVQLRLGDDLRPDQHGPEPLVGLAPDLLGADHAPLGHGDVDLLVAGLEVQDPALHLLPDELEDLRDAEVLEGALERHGQAPVRRKRSRTESPQMARPSGAATRSFPAST